MRSLIIGFVVFLAACNGSSTPVDTSQFVTQDQFSAQSKQLSEAVSAVSSLKAQMAKLSLIGKVHGVASAERILAIGQADNAAPSFGPCADMGVLIGRGSNQFSTDPLSAVTESFQTCMGYEYSVDVATKKVSIAPRIFLDGPNCTGNMYEWNSGGGSYNDQTLDGGVVFINPVDGVTSLMVIKGQTPQSIQIQSVWVSNNPGCQPDVEFQNLYAVTPNDINITGTPQLNVGLFQLASP